jgi:hypothetical protein
MGMIRKTASVCTFGMVKFTSRREAETKEAQAKARACRAQADLYRAQARAIDRPEYPSGYEYRPVLPGNGPVTGLPWYRQPTLGAAILALRENQK